MINYNNVTKWHQIKYSILHFYSKCKYKLYILGFLIVLFLITGIFTALKISDLEKAMKAVEFSFEAISDGKIYEFSFFIKRFLSVLLLIGIIFVLSLNKFTSVLSYMLISYRAFLVTLNCTLLVKYMGVIGAVNSVIIIFPCQILQLLLISLFFVLLCISNKEKRLCGKHNNNYNKYLLLVLLASFVVNVIELLLAIIFKSTTILIL